MGYEQFLKTLITYGSHLYPFSNYFSLFKSILVSILLLYNTIVQETNDFNTKVSQKKS